MPHTHSFIYLLHCIMFFSQYFSFPYHYHSTNAPYSFIHLPATLYNAFLQVLQFPLSVSFYNAPYSFIHLPPTLYNVFLLVLQISPVSIIPPVLHTHSFISHRRCIAFCSQYFSFPCQYHSTNPPYSFIHLPPTLYNVFLPVFQFPLSSFHQCSILFPSSSTKAVQCFSPSTSISPASIIPPMLQTNRHLHVAVTRRTDWRSLESSKRQSSFHNREALEIEVPYLAFNVQQYRSQSAW